MGLGGTVSGSWTSGLGTERQRACPHDEGPRRMSRFGNVWGLGERWSELGLRGTQGPTDLGGEWRGRSGTSIQGLSSPSCGW